MVEKLKDMEELRITDEEDHIVEIFLKPDSIVYARKREELITQSGMTEREADDCLLTIPIPIELFYSESQGLWGVEAEAVDCCEIYNPYTGNEIPNENLIYKNQEQ